MLKYIAREEVMMSYNEYKLPRLKIKQIKMHLLIMIISSNAYLHTKSLAKRLPCGLRPRKTQPNVCS